VYLSFGFQVHWSWQEGFWTAPNDGNKSTRGTRNDQLTGKRQRAMLGGTIERVGSKRKVISHEVFLRCVLQSPSSFMVHQTLFFIVFNAFSRIGIKSKGLSYLCPQEASMDEHRARSHHRLTSSILSHRNQDILRSIYSFSLSLLFLPRTYLYLITLFDLILRQMLRQRYNAKWSSAVNRSEAEFRNCYRCNDD